MAMEPYIHHVNYYETDAMRITHHSNYIRFMEEARTDYLERLGMGYDKMEADGLVSPVISVECKYLKTTTYADDIQIYLYVEQHTALKLVFGYVMKVRGEVVFTATSTHCFMDANHRPVSLERRYPEFFQRLLAVEAP